MNKDLRFLLDDPEQNFTGRFFIAPDDLDPEERRFPLQKTDT